jgi:hypothetical protein
VAELEEWRDAEPPAFFALDLCCVLELAELELLDELLARLGSVGRRPRSGEVPPAADDDVPEGAGTVDCAKMLPAPKHRLALRRTVDSFIGHPRRTK